MGILGGILGRRGGGKGYKTVDGGHPAPYPDMTDEQLYNYEIAFNVPHRTFDRPPQRTAREPYLDDAEPPQEGPEVDINRAESARDEPSGAGSNAEAAESSAEPAAYGAETTPVEDETAPALDFSRPIRTITTRQPVEVLTTRARHPVYRVHAYIGHDTVLRVFTIDGRLSDTGPRFLENVPEASEVYLNIYAAGPEAPERLRITQHPDRADADAQAGDDRLACLRVEL